MGVREAAEFYDSMIAYENTVKAIKEEVKDSIAAFSSSNGVTVKGTIRAIKDRKEFLKDKAEFLLVSSDSDKVFDLFDYDPNFNLFENS